MVPSFVGPCAKAITARRRTSGSGSRIAPSMTSNSISPSADRASIATRRTRAESAVGLSTPALGPKSEPNPLITDSACLAISRPASMSDVESPSKPAPAGADPSRESAASSGRPKATSSCSLSTDAKDIPVRPPRRANDSRPMTAPVRVTSGASPPFSRVRPSTVSTARRKPTASAYLRRPSVRPITARTAGLSWRSRTRYSKRTSATSSPSVRNVACPSAFTASERTVSSSEKRSERINGMNCGSSRRPRARTANR